MAVSIDTIYQRVLALANKEQRGYITPQEFNLFANQAQMEIFEQYFYDIKQFNRMPGNTQEYSDPLSVLYEKIGVFEVQQSDAWMVENMPVKNCHMEIPSEICKIGTVTVSNVVVPKILTPSISVLGCENVMAPCGGCTDPIANNYDPFASEDDGSCTYDQGEPPKKEKGSTTEGASTAGCGPFNAQVELVNSKDFDAAMMSRLTAPTPDRPIGCIETAGLKVHNGAGFVVPGGGQDMGISFIMCPPKVEWAYVIVNDKALYNDNISVDFMLHQSEETKLVYKILKFGGVSLKAEDVMQIGQALEMAKTQEEKQ